MLIVSSLYFRCCIDNSNQTEHSSLGLTSYAVPSFGRDLKKSNEADISTDAVASFQIAWMTPYAFLFCRVLYVSLIVYGKFKPGV